jgi:hypothetical protein
MDQHYSTPLKRTHDSSSSCHTYLTKTALDLLYYHQELPTKEELNSSPNATAHFTATFQPIPNQTKLYHQNHQTLLAITQLPQQVPLHIITNILLSPQKRPLWDIHCPKPPLLLAAPSALSTHEQRDIHPGRLSSSIQTLHLKELPVAARRFLVYRQWDYHVPHIQHARIHDDVGTTFVPSSVFVLSETPSPPSFSYISETTKHVPYTTVLPPTPFTIGWIVITTSPTTYALVALDDTSMGGWLPSSVAFELRQRMLLHRLQGICSTCNSSICTKLPLHRSLPSKVNHHRKVSNLEQLYPTIKLNKIDATHYLAPVSRTISLLVFAPQLLKDAADSYGPIERFKYAIASFVAGIHTTTPTEASPIAISSLLSSTVLTSVEGRGNDNGRSDYSSHHSTTTNNLESTITFQLTPLSRVSASNSDAATNTTIANNTCGNTKIKHHPNSSAYLRLHVPKSNVVEFLMTSQPIGSYEVGGSWTFDLSMPVTGVEGTTSNMTGNCIISFADSSHIEIAVLKNDKVIFEDPSHQLTCTLDLAGGDDSDSLEGTVLHDGSAVSTIVGTWKSSLLFDNWECWYQGKHETAVKMVIDNDEKNV